MPPKVEEVPATQIRTSCPAGYELATEVQPYSGLYFTIDESAKQRVIDGKHYQTHHRYKAPDETCIPLEDKSSGTD